MSGCYGRTASGSRRCVDSSPLITRQFDADFTSHRSALPPPRWFGSGLRPHRPRAIYHPPPPELQPEALRQQRLPPVREEAAAKADPNSSNYAQLSKKLNEGDIEGCKIAKEADRRERTAEIRREERPGPSTSACSRRASRTS